MKKFIALLCFSLLFGCASLENDPLKKAGAGIVFRHGISEFIERDENPADRAAKVLRYGNIFQMVLSKDGTTLDKLDQFLIEQLPKEQMLPGDYQDAVLIIQGAVALVRAEVADLPEAEKLQSAKVSADYFLTIAMQTARAYL